MDWSGDVNTLVGELWPHVEDKLFFERTTKPATELSPGIEEFTATLSWQSLHRIESDHLKKLGNVDIYERMVRDKLTNDMVCWILEGIPNGSYIVSADDYRALYDVVYRTTDHRTKDALVDILFK